MAHSVSGVLRRAIYKDIRTVPTLSQKVDQPAGARQHKDPDRSTSGVGGDVRASPPQSALALRGITGDQENRFGLGVPFPKPPRELAERYYTVTSWAEHSTGGHFPAVAEPELLARSLRDAFRPMR
jgi:hypothetical protein